MPRALTCLALVVGTLVATAGAAWARDLGTLGPTYAIAEPDLLRFITQRVQAAEASGELQQVRQSAQQRLRNQVENPPALDQITTATERRSFHHDPSIVVEHPVTDAEGRILVAPGTRLNPLDVVRLSQPLLFLDARDARQQAFAEKALAQHQGRIKTILTGGSYLELMRRWQRPVFHDQDGSITQRLGIRHVPALVVQEGSRLRIEESPP